MTIFFTVLEILTIAARVTVSFFPDDVPAKAATALTWACVIFGIIAAVFIGIEIYCKITGKGKKGE